MIRIPCRAIMSPWKRRAAVRRHSQGKLPAFCLYGLRVLNHQTPAGRQFEIEEAEELLKNKGIGPLSGFRSKMGRPFAAALKLVEDHETQHLKLAFDFGQENEDEASEAPDFSGQTSLGPCPKCRSR